MVSEPALQMAEEPAPELAIALDNREDGALAVCPVCGREYRAQGRNRNRRIYCSPKCGNRAWTRAHPRLGPRRRAAPPRPRRKRLEARAELTPALYARILDRATTLSLTLPEYVRSLLERDAHPLTERSAP